LRSGYLAYGEASFDSCTGSINGSNRVGTTAPVLKIVEIYIPFGLRIPFTQFEMPIKLKTVDLGSIAYSEHPIGTGSQTTGASTPIADNPTGDHWSES